VTRPPRVLFFGSRKPTAECPASRMAEMVEARVERLPDGALVIEGGAEFADRFARVAARRHGHVVIEVDALWTVRGRRAGPERNAVMASLLDPDIDWAEGFFACPVPERTPGTAGMARLLEDAGVPFNLRWPDGSIVASSGYRSIDGQQAGPGVCPESGCERLVGHPGPPLRATPTAKPCGNCGERIRPGCLYVPGDPPVHVACP
jgi:hypothetical protein